MHVISIAKLKIQITRIWQFRYSTPNWRVPLCHHRWISILLYKFLSQAYQMELFPPLKFEIRIRVGKVGCIFPVVILSEFRIVQQRDVGEFVWNSKDEPVLNEWSSALGA